MEENVLPKPAPALNGSQEIMSSRLFQFAAVSFLLFILWIIFLANTGRSSVFFEFVSAIPYGDKLGHFGLFGMLTLLFNLASGFKSYRLFCFSQSGEVTKSFYCYWGTSLVVVFSVLEEFSQGWLDTRTLDWQDLLADFFGISCFTLLSFWIAMLKSKNKQSRCYTNG